MKPEFKSKPLYGHFNKEEKYLLEKLITAQKKAGDGPLNQKKQDKNTKKGAAEPAKNRK